MRRSEMSMKGFFNPKQTNQHLQTELADFKHQIKRINTLEVHMNRFLKLEPQDGFSHNVQKKAGGSASAFQRFFIFTKKCSQKH